MSGSKLWATICSLLAFSEGVLHVTIRAEADAQSMSGAWRCRWGAVHAKLPHAAV